MTSDRSTHLTVRGLTRRFGARSVLRGVDLDLGGGECAALLGENGSGKSTLLRILGGILHADGGTATLDGVSLLAPEHRGRAGVGFMAEADSPLSYLTVGELLDVVATLKGAPRAAPADLERLGVAPLLGQSVGSLSLGQRQRTCLQAALLGAPRLLLLDEPTNGLDPEGVALTVALLDEHRARGGAALLTTHDLGFAAALGARRLRLEAGRVDWR